MDITQPRLLDAEGIDITLSQMSVFINHHSISFNKTGIYKLHSCKEITIYTFTKLLQST